MAADLRISSRGSDSGRSSASPVIDLRANSTGISTSPVIDLRAGYGALNLARSADHGHQDEQPMDLGSHSARPIDFASERPIDLGRNRRESRALRPRNPNTSYTDQVPELSDDEVHLNGHVNGFDHEDDSDDDDAVLEMPPLPEEKEVTEKEWKEMQKTIRRLREELRNEEMKLVLLKKLQQSHQMKENVAIQPHMSSSKVINLPRQTSGTSGSTNSSSMPPQMMRNSQGQSVRQIPQSTPQQMIMPPLVRPPGMHGPPPLLMGQRQQGGMSSNLMMQQQQNIMRSTTGILGRPGAPPNVVMGYPMSSNNPSLSILTDHSTSSALLSGRKHRKHQQAQSSSSPPINISQNQASAPATERPGDTQTPAQRQAAAKLALRKQLEKTLLQIPPPKPPPPEMHFIPNPNNSEFIYLVGLEACLNYITDDRMDNRNIQPFECVQCKTDFTPTWKWEGPDKKSVVCEQCVTTNIKKALKAEHTNRLKAAFVKALQQEQEIEQRMAQVSNSPPTTTSSAVPTSQTVPPPPVTTSSSQLPKLTEQLRPNNLAVSHQQLLRLPGHQPLPAHMMSPFSPLMAGYSYPMLAKSNISTSDLHRQYLLDMIPPRSLAHGTLNWKS